MKKECREYDQKKKYSSLITVLAFHVKRGNYAYTDTLSNALSIDAVEHALYDAVRDYLSLCADELEKGAEKKEGEGSAPSQQESSSPQEEKKRMEERCPSAKEVECAEKDIDELLKEYYDDKKPLIEFLRVSREIAMKAIAKSLDGCVGKEGGGSG